MGRFQFRPGNRNEEFSLYAHMPIEDDELQFWRQLSERLSAELDPDKLVELAKEIIRTIDERHARLRQHQLPKSSSQVCRIDATEEERPHSASSALMLVGFPVVRTRTIPRFLDRPIAPPTSGKVFPECHWLHAALRNDGGIAPPIRLLVVRWHAPDR